MTIAQREPARQPRTGPAEACDTPTVVGERAWR